MAFLMIIFQNKIHSFSSWRETIQKISKVELIDALNGKNLMKPYRVNRPTL